MIKKLLILIIIGFSLGFRLYYVGHYNFAFTIDQARDMLEIRKIAVGHHPALIGPITSLNGIYLGPFWYYYNLPPFVIGHGDPTFLVYWQIIIFHLVVSIFFLNFFKKKPLFAIIGTIYFLLSPRLIESMSYSFNANTTPTFILLSFIFLEQTLERKNKWLVLISGILVGTVLQVELAFGCLLIPLFLFWLYRSRISIKLFLVGLFITFIPQLFFEFRHQFLMTKVFFAEFSGKSDILGERLGIISKFMDRLTHYRSLLYSSTPLGFINYLLIFAALLKLIISKKNSRIVLISYSLILISVLVYAVYPNQLKDWWTINFAIPYIIIITDLFSTSLDKNKISLTIIFALALIYSLNIGINGFIEKYHQKNNFRSNDPALLQNQLEAIDNVYLQADGKGFKVYDYTPAVYDFNYQYLFWWYGAKTYHYQPISVTYQDNVPQYVDSDPKYSSENHFSTNPRIFLIEEKLSGHEIQEADWHHQFDDLCKMGDRKLTGNIFVERLASCHE